MKTVDITYRYEAGAAAARPRPSDAAGARQRLNDGNRAFAALLEGLADDQGRVQRIVPVDARDLGLRLGEAAAPGQRPFAAILGCSDARVPVELIFNEGPNDLFVVRVAGNGLGSEVIGSLKYAVDHLGGSLKLIAVVGHSGCGAVTTAVDVFLNPAQYLTLATEHALRNILDQLLIVVQSASRKLVETFGPDVARHAGYRRALIEAAIVTNAALAAHSIQRELGSEDAAGVHAVYGVYLLETREVWSPRAGHAQGGLAPAPRDAAGFAALAQAIVQSDRIASLLKSPV